MRALLALIIALSVACSSSSNSSSTCSGDGTTHCGSKGSITCAHQTYCDRATYATCLDGCYSNDNCACDETCVYVHGGSVGACQKN